MKKKIKKLQTYITKSADSKRLISNFSYMMLLQIAGYVFPLLTIPYLARTIGVEGFGKLAFAEAVIIWLLTITDWGFSYTATRDIAKNRDNTERTSEIFSNVLWAKILLMVFSFSILLIAIATIPYFLENQAILLVTFLLIPGHIMFPEWFFLAMERMKYITILNLLIKVIFTLMVFIFINKKEDFILQPFFISLGYLICGFFSMYLIVVKWKIKIHAPQGRQVLLTIRNSTDVFLNNIMPNLYNSFSTVLLGLFGGSVSNGLLDAGRKFIEVGQQFLMVLSKTFFPFLSRKINKHNIYIKFQMSFAIIIFIILISSAQFIIKIFFTTEFQPATLVLQIMSISIIFSSMNNAYGINFLIINGKEKLLRNITTIISLIGFSIAFPLIYYFDYIGVAITITITRALQGITVMFNAKKIKNYYK